jgi:hypothetical protein
MDAVEILKKMHMDIINDLYDALGRLVKELKSPEDGRSIDHADELWKEYRGLLEIEAAYDAAISRIEDKTK